MGKSPASVGNQSWCLFVDVWKWMGRVGGGRQKGASSLVKAAGGMDARIAVTMSSNSSPGQWMDSCCSSARPSNALRRDCLEKG